MPKPLRPGADYDFSKGTRGKFYHPDAEFSFPVYIESDVSDFMTKLAEEQDIVSWQFSIRQRVEKVSSNWHFKRSNE